MRHAIVAAALLLALPGCLANMGELKEALGVEEPVAPPPIAKAAAANPTAYVGEVVRFTAAGSRDPTGLVLSYEWDFGDGASGAGPDVAHAYTAPGNYTATLTVTNEVGGEDAHLVRVEVRGRNAHPVATAAATPTAAWVGTSIAFSSGGSFDPEGRPLRILWDFGDGATAAAAHEVHAYAAPGRYVARLSVVDDAGAESSATVPVAVSWSSNVSGVLDPVTTRANATLPVPSSPAVLRIVLAYDRTGGSDLALELRDAAGRLVEASTPAPTLVPGKAEVALDVPNPTGAYGSWTATVTRTSGARVPFTLLTAVVYA